MYVGAKNYSVCRAGLEVYKTDEENFKPYISSGVIGNKTSKSEESEDSEKSKDSEKDSKDSKETNDSSESEENEDSLGYSYHRGAIKEINYYANLLSANFEQDYKEMNSSVTITVPSIDKNKFYKGVRVTLKEEWEEEGKTLKWDDLKSVGFGFITDQTFNEENVEIKIDSASKLLDQKFNFEFKNMKRSKILEEIIKTAGLVPRIDVTGLDDDVTTFKSSGSKESSSSSSLAGGEGEEIDSLVKKWVGSETNDLSKAKKVHEGLKAYGIRYAYYTNSKYHTPQNCLKHANSPGLNCGDTAILTTSCMKSAGLNAYIVLRCDSAHFFTVIEIGGKKYYSDLTWSEGQLSKRAWNETWEDNKCGSKYNLT